MKIIFARAIFPGVHKMEQKRREGAVNEEFSIPLSVTAAAWAFARDLNDDQLALAAAALTQAEDVLAAIAVLRAKQKSKPPDGG